jgi:outer membrane lipoprotein-sorting protein
MKKVISLLLVLVVVLGCVGLAACGGGGGAVPDNGGAEPANGNGGGEPSNGGEEPSNGNGGGGDLDEIVANYTGFNTISYTVETSGPGTPTVEMQVWMEGNKVRVEMNEQGQHVIYIANYDAGEAYMYMPDQGIAMRIDISMAPQPEYEDVQDIAGYNYTVIGTETMDGKVCLVVEYSAAGATVKSWIWKEHGFPIRTEMTTSAGKAVTVFKDLDFSDIPDSLFELDPGVTIMEM